MRLGAFAGIGAALMPRLALAAGQPDLLRNVTAMIERWVGPGRFPGMVASLGLPLTPALGTLMTGSPAEAIEGALAWVDATHGSAAGYLRSGGMTEPEFAALRTRLTG